MTNTKELVLQIIKADKSMQKLLFGYYKSRLSQEQIDFLYDKLKWKKTTINTDDLVDYAEKTYGWRRVE